MIPTEPQFFDIGAGAARRHIAWLRQPGGAPGAIGLPGLKSDMISTKATALAQWSHDKGRSLLRFDYSGHGRSGGRFEDATYSDWLDEADHAFTTLTQGPQILVGSSTGGALALSLLRRLIARNAAEAGRVKALLLVAPAWDLTEELMWKAFPEEARRTIMDEGLWLRPSQYGEPYPITRRFIEDGRNHLFAAEPWNPGRPVHVIHGRLDPDVPYEHSLRLMRTLTGDWMTLTEVPDGEHRLSRPQDLALMFEALERLSGA